jgi:hypothetical protein
MVVEEVGRVVVLLLIGFIFSEGERERGRNKRWRRGERE